MELPRAVMGGGRQVGRAAFAEKQQDLLALDAQGDEPLAGVDDGEAKDGLVETRRAVYVVDIERCFKHAAELRRHGSTGDWFGASRRRRREKSEPSASRTTVLSQALSYLSRRTVQSVSASSSA